MSNSSIVDTTVPIAVSSAIPDVSCVPVNPCKDTVEPLTLILPSCEPACLNLISSPSLLCLKTESAAPPLLLTIVSAPLS